MSVLQKFLSFVLACASSATVARAQSQTTPSLEVKKLAVMVGKFTIEDELKAGFMGPNSPTHTKWPAVPNPGPWLRKANKPAKSSRSVLPESIWAELNLSRVSKQLNSVHFSSVRDHHCSSLLQSWHRSGFLVV